MRFHADISNEGISPFPYKKVAAEHRCDALLLRLPGCNVLWDTDCAATAPFVIEGLKKELSGERLDYILLSHSHYDHAGGVPYIQKAFPEVKIVAAEHAAEVFRKESAREKMLALDDALAGFRGIPKADREIFAGLHADRIVRDGDLLQLGETNARVIEAPGHTRDSICFFFEKEGFLISTETLGLLQRDGAVHVPMLLGSELTLASLRKIMKLPVKSMLLPHALGVIREEECRAFFETAEKCLTETREKVFSAIRNGKHGAELEAVLRSDSESGGAYDTSMIRAFELNTSIIARTLEKEYET